MSGAPVVQRYLAANEAELRAQLNLVQTATDKRLKALIKALRVSLPVAARADLQVRLTHAGANLVQIRATLVDVAHQHPVVYRPAAARPPGPATQPWNSWLNLWGGGQRTQLRAAVEHAQAAIRAARNHASLAEIFPGHENEARDAMTRAADLLDVAVIWEREQPAPGLTGAEYVDQNNQVVPRRMNLHPDVTATLLANPTAWDHGQNVLQHEAFHMVRSDIVDAFYRPTTNDAELWRRWLAKPIPDKLNSAPHYEEVVAASQGHTLRPAAPLAPMPPVVQAHALEASTTALHWAWTSATNASTVLAAVARPKGVTPNDPLHPVDARYTLFVSLVAGLGFHHRYRNYYLHRRNLAQAAGNPAPDKLVVLHAVRPDGVDRELVASVAEWLNPIYGSSMRRHYADAYDPLWAGVNDPVALRDAMVRRELQAAPRFRKTMNKDLGLIYDLQAGISQQGPRSPAVTIDGFTQPFIDNLP